MRIGRPIIVRTILALGAAGSILAGSGMAVATAAAPGASVAAATSSAPGGYYHT